MNKPRLLILSGFFILLGISAGLAITPEQKVEQVFKAKSEVRIKLVLGECNIKNSDDGQIRVKLIYSYDPDEFEAIFKEKETSLLIQEKFHDNNPRGFSTWTIEIPRDTEVDFESATGDLVITGWEGELEGNTGTGDIELIKTKGDFKLNTGTGSIDVREAQGKFDLNSGTGGVKMESCRGNFTANSGTGSVHAINLTFEDEGDFNSGTGRCKVVKPQGTDFEVSINSGTSDALLDLQGMPLEGYFEFTAHAHRGSIECPVKFDDEKDYEEGDSRYYRKSFTRGKKSPRYYIGTGTGTAELKK